jgi:hypothetical protein
MINQGVIRYAWIIAVGDTVHADTRADTSASWHMRKALKRILSSALL